jgi:hypothetical protein
VISRLAHDHGVPFPIAPIAGIAAAVVIGLLTAVSALRVRGVSLVIVTLAAADAIDSFYFNNTDWGAASNGSPVPEPHLFGLDRHRPRVPGPRRQHPQPCVRVLRPRHGCAAVSDGRVPAPGRIRAAHARRAFQRARVGRGGDQSAQRQADRVRCERDDRWLRGQPLRLQLRLRVA